MVIIIPVSKNPNNIHLEVWTLQPNPKRATRRPPANIPAMADGFDIDAAGALIPLSAALAIPYTVLFDNPHANKRDIVITTHRAFDTRYLYLYAFCPTGNVVIAHVSNPQ